ncbi:MAG: hypothetical protein GY856_17820, partial [bacterium]|nr:hypothetical protein [bacterium]
WGAPLLGLAATGAALAPGQGETVELVVEGPPEGAMTVCVAVDGEAAVNECRGRGRLRHRHTADGTALTGEDYLVTAGTLAFPSGATTAPVAVPVLSDADDEPDETFLVELLPPLSAGEPVLLDPEGVGTIRNDDFSPWTAVLRYDMLRYSHGLHICGMDCDQSGGTA